MSVCKLAFTSWVALGVTLSSGSALAATVATVRVLRFVSPSIVEVSAGEHTAILHRGERVGEWTLMQVTQDLPGRPRAAILEDFGNLKGHILVVDLRGVRLDLQKSLEATSQDPTKLFLGHTLDEIKNSASDMLGDQILLRDEDPDYKEVSSVFPPIRKMSTYSFIGSPWTSDKIGFVYGGRTSNFDPAPYYPSIAKLRESGKVWDGLVGGYLPILRFVYPESPDDWTEMISFAPLRISIGNDRIQPAWYRIAHVESGSLKWVHYIDSYHPFPPRTEYDPKLFYADLIELNNGWQKMLASGMAIHLPDERIENMARFSIVREIMTRLGDFPKYGVVDRDYSGSEHDGFPDTFTVDTTAVLEWGLLERAGRYIDNYFGKFVRDDGSILYRGPEIGQYGRMLTVAAQYFRYGGDAALLLKRRSRIDGVAKLLLYLREKAKRLPLDNPAYGMIAGWSEADASLDADPSRYMQPYFSNSAEAARGFRDLGNVWLTIGQRRKNAGLISWGQRLIHESKELQADMQTAISRSLLKMDGETILPSIAGVTVPFHIAVPRDESDPQFRSYRAYAEMMYSGILTKEQVERIVEYRSHHHDTILGVPTAYGFKTGDLAGFLSYGHGFGLIQHDLTREALLLLYSLMAHQYTRGTWMAPETRPVFTDTPAAPYCTPAQLVVPLMTRWMLVFEDPISETVWLGKAIPRRWFEDGNTISVSGAPTRWGLVGFTMVSHLKQGRILATLTLRSGRLGAIAKVRFRTPGQLPIRSVSVNDKPWSGFDSSEETITLTPDFSGVVRIVAEYAR